MYDFNTESITQITDTNHDEAYPVASKDNTLFYTADYNGVYNIFKHDLITNEAYPITNVITGIQQIDVDRNADKIIFFIQNVNYDFKGC